MATLIPDVHIVNTLNNVLNIIRENHISAVDLGQEDRSLLYILFNGLSVGKYDYYENIKSLLITTPQDPKHLDVKLSYNHNTNDPTTSIYVSLTSENTINNSLSINEGDNDELVFENGEGEQSEYIKQYGRRFGTTYYVVIVGENKNQVTALYTLVRAMIIACINHFEMRGLSNLKIGGQDIRLQAMTDRIFSRAISLNFEYNVITPEIFIQSIFSKLIVNIAIDTTNIPPPLEIEDSES